MEYKWYKKGTELLKEISEMHLPRDLAAMWYIGQMGIIVKWNGITVAIDPVLNDICYPDGSTRRNYEIPFEAGELTGVDYVLCSHNHVDHLNLQTLLPMYLADPKTKFVVPAPEMPVLKCGGIPSGAVIGAREGEEIELVPPGVFAPGVPGSGAVLHPVAAAHEEYVTDESGDQRNLGYVLNLGGIKLYHGGDTMVTERLIGDLQAFAPFAAACLPVNGADAERHSRGIMGNMDCRDGAYLASVIMADVTVPLHCDMVMKNGENPLVFAYYMQEYYPGRKYGIMQLGECMVIKK